MKTKNTLLTIACAMLFNPSMLSAQWSAVRYDLYNVFYNVSAPTSNTVFTTGTDYSGTQHFVIRTNDAGNNWDSIPFNTATDSYAFTELFFLDANTGFVGGTKNSNQVLLKTTDNGNSWTDVTPNPSSTNYISSVHFLDSQNGVATDGAFLYKTFNGGTTWTSVPSSFNIRDVYFLNMNLGFACGDNGAAVVMRTTDGGQYWGPMLSVYNPNLFVSSFAKLDVINPYVIFTALENSDKLYRTMDIGYTWDTIAVDSARIIRDFDFIDANEGHVLAEVGWMGEHRILLTVDGGQDWDMEYTTGWNFYGGGVSLNALAFVDQTGYATGTHGLVKKYSPSTAGISEAEFNGTVSVYPNPFSSSATLRISDWSEAGMKHAELKIYDVLGSEVFRSEIRTPFVELKRGNLPNGVYVYSINNGHEVLANGKLIVTD